MVTSNSDREWEKFGRDDPYFGVITHEKFRKANLTDAHREEFFRSGIDCVDDLLRKIRLHVDPDFQVRRALEFGCGVGRLVIPLAKIAQQVTGADVSDSMLHEARRNCEARSINNVVLVKSDDTLSALEGNYDFIYSIIVFQHIPVPRGERIFAQLLAHLEPGGVGVVHFTYAREYTPPKWVQLVKKFVPWSYNVFNLLQGKEFFAPCMQMNTYDLNRLFLTMQQAAVSCCHLEFTNHGGELGVMVWFRS